MREPCGMDQLRAYLTRTNITQSAFAGTIGLSRSHLSEIISGRKRPSLDVAFAIARATSGDVPVEAWADPIPTDVPTVPTPNKESSHDQPHSASDAA